MTLHYTCGVLLHYLGYKKQFQKVGVDILVACCIYSIAEYGKASVAGVKTSAHFYLPHLGYPMSEFIGMDKKIC